MGAGSALFCNFDGEDGLEWAVGSDKNDRIASEMDEISTRTL